MYIVAPTQGERPAWDGRAVLFQTDIGGHLISCSISKMALHDFMVVGSEAPFEPVACFEHHRERIEVIAREKFLAQANPPSGRLHIWWEDVLDPSPSASPLGAAQVASLFFETGGISVCRRAA